MDSESNGLSENDVGVDSWRDVRLDRYRPMGNIGESIYHLEICLRGKFTKLFILNGGPIALMVDRFLELLPMLVGETRCDGIKEQACNAVFHECAGLLAEILRAGRGNTESDNRWLTHLDDDERLRLSKSNCSSPSDASVETPIRTAQKDLLALSPEERAREYERAGSVPTDYAQRQGRERN